MKSAPVVNTITHPHGLGQWELQGDDEVPGRGQVQFVGGDRDDGRAQLQRMVSW